MQKPLKKLSKMASSLLSLAIISSSLFVSLPSEEVNAAVPGGDRDISFNTGEGPGLNKTGFFGFPEVVDMVLQNDNKLIIVGNEFSHFNDTSRSGIARINSNGSLDTTFNVGSGFTGNLIEEWDNLGRYGVSAIALQPDGKVIVVGSFKYYNNTSQRGIARINSDGSLDTTFSVGTGFDETVTSIAIQGDGKIIVGGYFSQYNGTNRTRIARINSDGSIDTTFNPGTGVNNIIYSIVIDDNNKILIGGAFHTYNGITKRGIARLNSDGSLDSSFNNGGVGITGVGDVKSISIQNDGKIIIAGNSFYTYNSSPIGRALARLNADGTLDTTFNTNIGDSIELNSSIFTTSIQSDGKIIIGGNFMSFNGNNSPRIARLNSNGSFDASFNVGVGANNNIWASLIQDDGKIVIGGAFTGYNPFHTILNQSGQNNVKYVARLNSNGSLDSSLALQTGFSDRIFTISQQSDGKFIIGGWFYSYNSINTNMIARLNTDGSLDTSFNIGTGANAAIYTTLVQNNGKIIIGGAFTNFNGTNRNRIMRLNSNGSIDNSFNVGTGANDELTTSLLQKDGKIIIGGWFNSYNGVNRNYIARINSNGSLDTSFDIGDGPDNGIESMVLQSDGKIIIGGWFNAYNGIERNYIARLNSDGSLDTSFNVGMGTDDGVYSLAMQNDGKILIGGYFTEYNGVSAHGVARLNSDGSIDTTFESPFSGSSGAEVLEVDPTGRILIGGWNSIDDWDTTIIFTRLNSDGSIDDFFSTQYYPDMDNIPTSFIVQPDGRIIMAGRFAKYNGLFTPHLVRFFPVLYQADNLDPSLDLGINGTSLKVGTQNGSRSPSEQVTLKATGNVPLSDFVVDFSNGDVDFAGVTAGSDSASGKAFLSGLNDTAIPELSSTHSLYIPKHVGQTSVHICPDATQMSEVFMGCSNGYTLNYGTASNLSIVNIDSQDYWRVTGLTGTGGLGTYSNGVLLTITPNNGLESVAQEVDVTYTSGGGFVNGDVIQLTWDAGITLANCTTPTTDADGDLTNDGSSSVTGQTYTYTYSGNATSSVDLCMSVQGLSGNYAVTLNDDNGSFSSALYYINPEGGDVNVIANIAPTLSFNIRNIDDSADLNVCNFGDVSTSTPIPNVNGVVDGGECGYSLAVGTNSSSGFTMQMSSNGQLSNGVSNINNVLNNGTWSAGEEAYGIAQVIVGQTGRDPLSGDYDQSLTREGNFLTDTTPVPTTATDFVTYTDGVQYEAGNLDTDVTKVIHGLVVGAGTPAGSYSQVVTYTLTASF
jgi:uncharacterized delta-60 repeat protein